MGCGSSVVVKITHRIGQSFIATKIIKALKRAVENPIGVRGEASISMELTISKNGDLLNVEIIHSSGNSRFD